MNGGAKLESAVVDITYGKSAGLIINGQNSSMTATTFTATSSKGTLLDLGAANLYLGA